MSRNELLSALVRADVVALRAWLKQMPADLRLRVRMQLTGGMTWTIRGAALPEGGGMERLTLMLQRIDLDVNGDGLVTDAEYSANEKAQLRMVDTCATQLLNMGIVAGLSLTVFYPMAVAPLIMAEDSLDFFGKRVLDVFTYAFYIFMYYCVVESVVLIMTSTRAYLHLTMWMPSLDAKLWYLDRMRMSDYVASCFNIIKSVVWSVPMGVCVSVSPLAGAFAVVSFLYFYAQCLRISRADVDCMWFLRQYADIKLKSKAVADTPDA